MADKLPGARAALVDDAGVTTPQFYRYFQALERLQAGTASAADITAINAEIAALQAQISALPESSFPTLQVAAPLTSSGLLQNGFAKLGIAVANSVVVNGVTLQLDGDALAPGNTYLYSTSPTGTKGWNALGGMLFGTPNNITTTINANGTVTFALSPQISQPTTNQFFTQKGATIQRFSDRVFIGGATAASGDFPQTTNDWFSDFEASVGYVNPSAPSMLFASTNTAKEAASAITAAAQSLYFTAGTQSCIGLDSFAVNNNTTIATDAWAFYGEGHHTTATAGSTYGMELDTRTTSAVGKPNPFSQGSVVALQLASGCGLTATGQFDASAAIQIESNPMKFQAGIVFGSTSITGADGTGGGNQGTAIALSTGHVIEWYSNNGSVIGRILSNNSGTSNACGINFTGVGIQFHSVAAGNPSILFAEGVSNAVNFVAVTNAVAGQPPYFSSGGSDTNVDLMFLTQGTGVLRFGTFTSGAPSANGYITIKDAGGTVRKLLCG